jgi:hypothetical protein
VTLLHFFVKTIFHQLQKRGIQLFVSCHLRELISDHFFGAQIGAMLISLTAPSTYVWMYATIKACFKRDRHIYPLLIYLMLRLGQDVVDAFVESLVPSASFMIHKFWAVQFFLLMPLRKDPKNFFCS